MRGPNSGGADVTGQSFSKNAAGGRGKASLGGTQPMLHVQKTFNVGHIKLLIRDVVTLHGFRYQ